MIKRKHLVFITLFTMIISYQLSAGLPAFGYFPSKIKTKTGDVVSADNGNCYIVTWVTDTHAGSCWSDYANTSWSYESSRLIVHYYFDYVTNPCPVWQNRQCGTVDSKKTICTRKKRAKIKYTFED